MYSQVIRDVDLLGVIGDNYTPQQQETQQQVEKSVEIQYDIDMTQVDTAKTEPNPSGTRNRT